jgi:hypothetical protein
MGFETVVLDKVAKVLESDNKAEFFCGTLCVVCTATEARKVFKQLNKDYNNKVEMNPDGSYGYTFDFTA